MSIYDFEVLDQEENKVSLKKYEGKVLLIVNTATKCGFTPQYEAIEKLYETYKNQGFEVLDFPCNQFMNQAPGEAKDINSFCSLNYNTQFPRFKKVKVNGKDAEPLYVWLKNQKHGLFKRIKWNFEKFLVNKEGKVVARFSPTTKPEKLEGLIKELLEK